MGIRVLSIEYDVRWDGMGNNLESEINEQV